MNTKELKPGTMVMWKKEGGSYIPLTFLRFSHWGGIYGEFLLPNGKVIELGVWGVRSLEEFDETG